MRDKSKLTRTVALIVLALLLLGSSSLESGQYGNSPVRDRGPFAEASSPTASQYGMIELGYDTTTLVPVNVSLPTYTVGDQMWMLSEFNISVNAILLTPEGTIVTNETVEPNAATLVFSFTAPYEYDGNWSLKVSNSIVQNFSIPIVFVAPGNHAMQAVMSSYNFQQGQLALGFSLSSSPGSYGIQGCLLPTGSPNAIIVNVPDSAGSEISVQNQGNGSVSISAGVPGETYSSNSSLVFEFWLELYYQYSYQTFSPTSSFFSTYQEVALTNPVLISPLNENAHPALIILAGMRSGTYELRTFFESGGNLSVEQTTILVQGPFLPWTWLGGCTMSSLNGPTFLATTTLSNSSKEWPTTLFLSYHVNGISFYLLQPLSIQIAGFTLFVSALQQLPTNIGIEVNVSKGASEVIGESVFIASPDNSIQVNYSLSFGGKAFQRSAPTYYTAYTTFVKQYVDLGKMTVNVTHDGRGYRNATVTLMNNALDGNVTLLSGSQGNATFFGPSGSYTLIVSVNGSTISRSVSLKGGQSSTEQISIDPSSGGTLLSPSELDTVILASVVGGLGILANLWVWAFRSRRVMRK